jgi:hypothetical protein
MQAFSLCQKECPNNIPVTVTNKLGDGADGDVYDISGSPNKVIKFGVLYDDFTNPLSIKYLDIENALHYIKNNNPSVCACVYDYNFLIQSTRKVMVGTQDYILYYYIMEKLNKISEDEKKVFHTIFSHEDRNLEKHFSVREVTPILSGLSKGLDFDMVKVTSFHSKVINSSIKHLDMHPRNIMKAHDGSFKFIDFDRINIEEGNGDGKKY